MVNEDTTITASVTTDSPEATRSVGECLGRACSGGEVLLLFGDLGAGKTCFVQGLAKGMGVDAWVTSPTFTIHGEYPGSVLALNHLDLYRLDDPASQEGLGIEDMLGDPRAVAAVEWPEMLADPVRGGRIEVRLADAGEGKRSIAFTAFGEAHAALLAKAMDNSDRT